MSLPVSLENEINKDQRVSVTRAFQRNAYSKVILCTKSNMNVNPKETEFHKKNEITQVHSKNFSATLVSDNYNSYTTYDTKKIKPLNNDGLSSNIVISPPKEELKTYNQEIGRTTHFINKTNHIKLLSNPSVEEKNPVASSGSKLDIVSFNRLTNFHKPIKKRRDVKTPLTHVPYNECQSEDSFEGIDFNNNETLEGNDNFFKTNESVKLDSEKTLYDKIENDKFKEENENEKFEKERMEYSPPEGGAESGALDLDYDSIKIVYQNHENNCDLLDKPTIRRRNLEEKVSSFGIVPIKLNLKKVKNLLDEIKEENSKKLLILNERNGNESGVKNEKAGKKLKDPKGKEKYVNYEIENFEETYSFRNKKRNKRGGNKSFDESEINCLANERCSIF